MKVAVITPTDNMQVLTHFGLGYNFILGQKLIQDIIYYEQIEDLRRRGSFIIVDNGAAEPEDEREPFDLIAQAAMGLMYDEIILPDKLRDAEWTIKHSLDPEVLEVVPYNKRMVVPQGKDWDEWVDCLTQLIAGAQPATIGIAKWLEELPGGRPYGLAIIMKYGYHKRCNIHLLGIHSKPFAEMRYAVAVLPTIRGVDTGAPIAYAQNDEKLSDNKHFSLDWNRHASTYIMYDNISDYVRFCHKVPYEQGSIT
jgi:hypothetical protein